MLVLVLLILLTAALLAYGAIWGERFALAALGPFAPLTLVVAAGLAVMVVGPWLLVRYRRPLGAVIVWIATWLWLHAQATGFPRWFAARYPRLARFISARLARTTTGLGLTVGLVAAGAALWVFLELSFEVITGSRTVSIDHRIINLVATLRTPTLDRVMYAITLLGNGETIVVLAGTSALIALLARRGKEAALLLLAVLASTLFFSAVKLLVGRPRPPLEDARIVQGGFSFPSGHSTLAAMFYGTLAYLLIRALRHERYKILVSVAAALLIMAIGVSRVYLGVHYPSDVLAGWAAGALWLVLVIVADQVWLPRHRLSLSPRRRAVTWVSGLVLTVAAVGFLASIWQGIPPPPAPRPAAPIMVAAADVPATVLTGLPHYTETILGHPQEPISIVFVGTQAEVESAFRAAGWSEARRFGLGSVEGGVAAALTHRADPTGPVTPSFLAEQPNALAFSQPVGKTFAQRHHIRIWTTHDQTSDGRSIWLATASYDRGFELAPTTYLPTHQIDPNIDAERGYIITSLESSGAVTQDTPLQLVPPESGHNFDGDPFYTDGKAVILWLG